MGAVSPSVVVGLRVRENHPQGGMGLRYHAKEGKGDRWSGQMMYGKEGSPNAVAQMG